MGDIIYTAKAHVTGGRDGRGRSTDGELDVALSVPEEMGGDGDGTNPEELFAIGYAACFESAVSAIARSRELDPGEVTIDAAVSLHSNEGDVYDLAVTLDVALPAITDEEAAAQLVRAAHKVCPYSRATRGNVDVELLLAGDPI